MAEDPEPEEQEGDDQTPSAALFRAIEKVDDMESVLILYECKPGKGGVGSFDSGLTASECIWLIEVFRYWLMSSIVKVKDKDE